jgi:CheY-like chemotaxis protein
MSLGKIVKPIDILLVEDNPADIRLTKEALKESKVKNKLYVVEDGSDAIKFLRRKGKYKNAIRPDLILLDLNLPKKHGVEVLEEIKFDEDLKRIPVVVLTVSNNEEDIFKT